MIYQIEVGDQTQEIELPEGGGAWDVARGPVQTISLLRDGCSATFAWARLADGSLWLGGPDGDYIAEVRDPRQMLRRRHFEQSGRVRLAAPMAGKVVKVLVAAGAAVEKGQGVVVLEAMKMQNEVRSPKSGTLAALAVKAGEAVATGQLLAEVE